MSSPALQVGGDGAECPPPYNSLVNTSDNPTHSDQQDTNNPPPYFQLENVLEAPPDYYSIFINRLDSDGRHGVCWACFRKTLHIVLSTVGFSVLLVVFMSVPFAMLVIGSIFVGKCPIQPNIPVFLVVAGILGILKNLFLICERLAAKHHQWQTPQWCPGQVSAKHLRCGWRLFSIAFNLFMLAWIISGSYWIYHVYKGVSSDGFKSCNEVVYKFAFGAITSSYIILVLVITCMCCCALCLKRNVPEHSGQDPDQNRDRGEGAEEAEGDGDEEEEEGQTVDEEGATQTDESNDLGMSSSDLDTQLLTQRNSMPETLPSTPSSLGRTSYLSTVV